MSIKQHSKVRDLMTRDVASVDENDDLNHLLDSLEVLRFRHMPVTQEGRLVGLLTERDILGLSASTLLPHQAERDRFLKGKFRVRDVMRTELTTVSADLPLPEAAALMLTRRIGCLPVVDDQNVLQGLLTSSDFVRLIAESRY